MSVASRITVRDDPAREQYEALVDGRLAGRASYRLRPGRVVSVHTAVLPGFTGAGVASAPSRAALEDVRRQGEHATPTCPFIAGWIQAHPDYADLVDAGHAEAVRPDRQASNE